MTVIAAMLLFMWSVHLYFFLPCCIPAIPQGVFLSVCIKVFLLYPFIAFQFYEIHFETRKHEPLRKNNPFKDSHCLSRISLIFASPVRMKFLLSSDRHLSYFFWLKVNLGCRNPLADFIPLFGLPSQNCQNKKTSQPVPMTDTT
jgi:hypothetical protein